MRIRVEVTAFFQSFSYKSIRNMTKIIKRCTYGLEIWYNILKKSEEKDIRKNERSEEVKAAEIIKHNALFPSPFSNILWPGRTDKQVSAFGAPKNIDGRKEDMSCETENDAMKVER